MAYKDAVPNWIQPHIDALKQFVRDQFTAEGLDGSEIITIQATGSRVYEAFPPPRGEPALPGHSNGDDDEPPSDLDIIAWLHTSTDLTVTKVHAPIWNPGGPSGIQLDVEIRIRYTSDGVTLQGPTRQNVRPEGFTFPLWDLYSKTFVEGVYQDVLDWKAHKANRKERDDERPTVVYARLRHRLKKLEEQAADFETRITALEP